MSSVFDIFIDKTFYTCYYIGMDKTQETKRDPGRPRLFDEEGIRTLVTLPKSITDEMDKTGNRSAAIREIILSHYGYEA